MALRFTLEINDQVATMSLYEEVAHDSDDRVRADAARNSLSRWDRTTPNLFSERQASAAQFFVGWVLMIQDDSGA